MSNPCPCCSGKPYKLCCEPVVKTSLAPTALALMRSRFTAYHHGLTDYILQTTHQSTRKKYNTHDISEMSNNNTWTVLEILATEHGGKSDTRGIVEFKAHYIDEQQQKRIHHERSTFIKEHDRWYFLEGQLDPSAVDLMKKISRNDPCPCGSGKKHKKCCG